MFSENEKNKTLTKIEDSEKILGQEDAIKTLRGFDKLNESCLSQTSNQSEPKLSAQNKQDPELKAKTNCQYNAGTRDLKRKQRRIKKLMNTSYSFDSDSDDETEGLGSVIGESIKRFSEDVDEKRHHLAVLLKVIRNKYANSETLSAEEIVHVFLELEDLFLNYISEAVYSRFSSITVEETLGFRNKFENIINMQTLPKWSQLKEELLNYFGEIIELIRRINKTINHKKQPIVKLKDKEPKMKADDEVEVEKSSDDFNKKLDDEEEKLEGDEEVLDFIKDNDDKIHHIKMVKKLIKQKYVISNAISTEEIDKFFEESIFIITYFYSIWIPVEKVHDFRQVFESKLNDEQSLPEWLSLKQEISNFFEEAVKTQTKEIIEQRALMTVINTSLQDNMKQKSTENSKKIIAQAPVSSGSELDDWDVLLEGVKRKIKPTIRIKSINIKTISKLVKEKFVSIPKKEQDVFFDEVRKEAYDPSISLENIMELRKRLCAQFNNNQVFPSWPSLKNEICESAYTIRGQIEKIHGKKVDARLIKIVKNGDLASLKKEVTPENVNIIVSIYAETLLIVAIKNNHTSIVEFLLEQGADINVAVVIGPYKGSTALGHAVFNKRWDLVNKLLEKNPKINANAPYSDDNPGESVLWWAALFNQWQLVSKLLELDPIANIDATSVSGSCQGMTVLWLAANNNEWELVNKMLKHNSNANIEATPISGSLHGKTVLWLATVALQTAMVKILLARGANIDCQFQGMTLIEKLKTLSLTIPAILTLNTLQAAKDFHTLSNTNNIDYNHITTLLDQGAHWNQRDSKGNTPLHVACDLNNADFIKQLAKQPKEYQELILCATNKARDTALDILARNKISYKKSLAALMNIIQPFIFSKIPFYLYMRQISSLIFYTAKFIGKTYFFGTSLKGKELILAELGKICNRQGSQEIFLQRKFEEASKANSISLTFQFNRPLTYGNFTTSRTLPLTNLTSSSSGLKQRDVPDNSVPGECSNMAIETNQEKINDASPDLWEPSKRAKLSC